MPGIDLGGECGTIWKTPAGAPAIKDADFDFGQVKPTGMLRSVVEYGAAQQFLRFLDAEHFLKTRAEMGIEIIHDQMDTVCRGINPFEQMPDEGHEVGLGPAIGDDDGTPSALGLHRHEQIAGAGTRSISPKATSTMSSFSARRMASCRSSSGQTHTGQPGPGMISISGGRVPRIPEKLMLRSWPPQTFMILTDRGSPRSRMRASQALAFVWDMVLPPA